MRPTMRPGLRNAALRALTPVLALLLLACVIVPAGFAAADPGDRRPRFTWPLEPDPPVTRAFDPPESDFGSGHRGVDLAATPGQRVRAVDAGVVVFAGRLAGRGVVSIQHQRGLRTTYEPVRPVVTAGTRVYQGQVIGTVVAGHPACSAKACLHWGVRNGQDDYLDPLMLVRNDVTIRLKPWHAS